MDEPLGTLDAEFRELMCVELRKLHDRLRTTTVFVTHDQNEAMALADHIVVMHEGEILQADDPDGIYHFPSCMFVAGFIGRPPMNLLDVAGAGAAGRDRRARGRRGASAVPAIEARGADSALLGVRPEHVRLAARGDGALARRGAACRVLRLALGRRTRHGGRGAEGGGRQGRSGRAPASASACEFDTARIVLFDAATEQLLPSATTRAHRSSIAAMASVALRGIVKRFGAVQAVDDLPLRHRRRRVLRAARPERRRQDDDAAPRRRPRAARRAAAC